MHKSADAYRSIGEVARLIGVAPHVLRYWETQFPQLAPVKRPDGRRYYRLDDVLLAAGLAEVMREEGLTTRGAARLIAMDKGAAVRAKGKARLPARFGGTGVDAGAAEDAPARAASVRSPRGARPRRTATPDAERPMPLFSEALPPSPAASATVAPPHQGAASPLARMIRVTAALRGAAPAAPHPAQAEALHRRLRAALDALA